MKRLTGSSFPGLATALNPEEMLDLLRNALADGHRHLQVREAKIMDVKYEPGKEGIVLYRFKIKDRLTKINHKQLFTASLMKENDEPPQEFGWENVMRYPRSENLLVRKPFLYLAGPRILLYAFPYDPSIPWLGNLLDEQFLKERLNLKWSSKGVNVQEVRTDLLGYTPQLRGVFLHRIRLQERTRGVEHRSESIGKTSSYKAPEVLFADQWALWRACRGRVGIPQPEGYLSHPRLTLQERVAGERLSTLVNTPSFKELLCQTANSIAVIHGTQIPLNKMRDPIRETQSLRRWGVVLQDIRSDLAQRIQILHKSLLREMERRTTVTGTVHGDFHPANVLVDGNKIWLIDFDQMAYGDPSADVGRFLASLRILSLRNFGDISSLKGSRELFMEEYLKSGCGNAPSIHMFESASLLTTAGSAFRVQRAGWEQEVFLLLEEAERVFEESKLRTRVAVRSLHKPSLKYEDRRNWFLDPAYMQASLEIQLGRDENREIFSCEVLKTEQTESGCRTLYQLAGQKNGTPWNREVEAMLLKGRGKRSMFNQLVLLHQVSMQTEGAFMIPEPVGYLSPIGTIVQIPLAGVPISSLLKNGEFQGLAMKLARAISINHRTAIGCPPAPPAREVCERLEREIKESKHPSSRFLKLLSQARGRIPDGTPEDAVTIQDLNPDHVVLLGDRLGLSHIQSIARSHPCLDIGEFLARLKMRGSKNNQQKEAGMLAAELRGAYCALTGESSDLLAAFETLAILRLVCSSGSPVADYISG